MTAEGVDVWLATCSRLPEGDDDAPLVLAALERLGVGARWGIWDDPAVDWASAPVVLRSTWDYMPRRDEFLRWVDGLPAVANPADVVRWSSDKSYLADLDAAGLPVVPTTVANGTWEWPDSEEVVVKPSVGAGSRGVGRFARDREDAAREHAERLVAAGRTPLVQPYLADVDVAGETAQIFVDGAFSHAIRKAAMLGDGVVHPPDTSDPDDDLYAPESIEARTPTRDERAVAEAVVAAVRDRFGSDQLYARVDLLPGPDGPVVVEVELVEPSLFLSHAGGDGVDPEVAADRLAAGIRRRL